MNPIKKFFKDRANRKETKLMNIVQDIQDFYIQKHMTQCDTIEVVYAKARESLTDLGITKIDLKGNTVVITLTRPGLLIGRYGDNINALETFLKPYKVDIVEEKILIFLLPYIPEPYDLDDNF